MKTIPYRILLLSATGLLTAGCSTSTSLTRMQTRLDVMGAHVETPGNFLYQGQLRTAQSVGSMTAMAFVDGKEYDVAEAPPSLYPGDVVRIYTTERGYVARLWKSVESVPKS